MSNTEKENWNKICDIFDKNLNSPEDEIQKIWETILSEIFGYSSLDEEIDSHRKMQLGSTERLIPDIIIKKQGNDLFAIELKQENLSVSQQYLEQTFSYLNQLKCDLGILICNKICLIDYVYTNDNEEQIKFEISFTKDNPDGIKFVELFSKENFNKDAVKEFIRTKEMAIKNVEDIKKEISNSLIMDLLKQYFSEKYSEEEFDEAIKEFDIIVAPKNVRLVNKNTNSTRMNSLEKNTSNNINIQKNYNLSQNDKLIRDLRTVGYSTFIKYFDYFLKYDTRQIKNIMQETEIWSYNSFNTKSSTGKNIIKRGLGIQALAIIADSNNTDIDTINNAKKLYDKYKTIGF